MLTPTQPTNDGYDLLVVALGYEPRSIEIARVQASMSATRLAIAFDTPGLFAYDDNALELSELQFEFVAPTTLSQSIESSADVLPQNGSARISVDISSLSRSALATILVTLQGLSTYTKFTVDFWYTPPKFDADIQPSAAIESAELISPMFAGLAADPLDPVAGVIGVGYEPNLALGVAEYLDVASVHAFVPYGHDENFDEATLNANAALFLGETPCRRSAYDLTKPYDLYVRLESLIYGLSDGNRVAVVPLGPKMFALCAILIALQSERPIAVWRFSGGKAVAAAHEAGGPPIRLTVASSAG